MWPLLLSLAHADPGLQVYAGLELGVNLGRGKFPLTGGVVAAADFLPSRDAITPKAGLWGRAQIGARPYTSASVGLRAGVSANPSGDGLGYHETWSVGLEAGALFGGRDGMGQPAQVPALYLGGHGRLGGIPFVRGGVALGLEDGGAPRMGTVGVGMDLPLLPVFWIIEGRPLRQGSGWLAPRVVGAPSRWKEAAAEEGSAVGTFLRLAAELRALGAPARLVHRVMDAAEDEVRHVLLCAREGDLAVGPLPLLAARRGDRTLRLARIAAEGILDGAGNEGRAADRLERDGGEVRGLIALEERRHAVLGGDVAAWAAREGGRTVRRTVADAERALAA